MSRCHHCNSVESVRRDLHDKIASPLAGLIMEIELVRQLVRNRDADGAYEVLGDTRNDLIELMARTRRISSDSGCSQNVHLDVEQALRAMFRRINRAAAPKLEISLSIDPEIRTVGDEAGRAAFWIVREAVTNVLNHSNAKNCSVTLRVERDGLCVLVVDDGQIVRESRRRTGSGISNMVARAEELGGWCATGPDRVRGFVVSAYLPRARKPVGHTEIFETSWTVQTANQ